MHLRAWKSFPSCASCDGSAVWQRRACSRSQATITTFFPDFSGKHTANTLSPVKTPRDVRSSGVICKQLFASTSKKDLDHPEVNYLLGIPSRRDSQASQFPCRLGRDLIKCGQKATQVTQLKQKMGDAGFPPSSGTFSQP